MKKNIFVLLVLALYGCNNTTKVDQLLNHSIKHKSVNELSAKPNNFKHKLIGLWTDGSSGSATFDIKKDSIFYVDQFKSYKYSQKQDSIKIYYPDFTYTAKVYFTDDTLVMDSHDDGIAKFWKFKN